MHTVGMSIQFIERCFGSAKLTNAGLNANVCCPICGDTEKKKLAIRTDNFLTKCWKCGYKARSIYGLLKRFKPVLAEEFVIHFGGANFISDEEEKEFKKDQERIEIPFGFQFLAEQLNSDNQPYYVRQAIQYLKKRGLDQREFWFFKLGITILDKDYLNRIIIPSHDADGNLNFFTSRAYKTNIRPKYFNPKFHRETVVFNEINIDWSDELTIVEGPFDLFKVNDNATCLLGKELTKEYLLFQKVVDNKTPVLLCLDNDAKRDTLKIAKLLYEYDVPVRIMELPYEIKDPGEITRDKFLELKQKCAVEFDDLYYLRNIIK